MNKPKIILTHSGRFHADEVFGTAVLKLVFPDAQIVRTRDKKEIESAHIVLDVGGVYDEIKDRFDHHQIGGAGKRDNGIPYASFGLVWKKYGTQVCGDEAVAKIIDKNLVSPIDAMDNGINLVSSINEGAFPVFIQDIFFLFTSTWQEKERTLDQGFFEVFDLAHKIIMRSIVHARAQVVGDSAVLDAYKKTTDKRLVILEEKYSYGTLYQYPDLLFVVIPDSQPGQWKLQAVEKDDTTYSVRKSLPESWAGKRDLELQKETGVSDALFCHNARFMAVTKSKEGALELAQIALKD